MSEARALPVPQIAVLRLAHEGEMAHHPRAAGTMMNARRTDLRVIAPNGPGQREVMNARAETIVGGTNGPHVEVARVTAPHSGATAVAAIAHRAADRHVAMTIVRPIAIAVRGMIDRIMPADQGELRKAVMMMFGKRSVQDRARVPDRPPLVEATGISDPSACVPDLTASTPATERAKAVADHRRASRN